MSPDENDGQDWDLEERDSLLADGTLTDEEAPDPTVTIVKEDE